MKLFLLSGSQTLAVAQEADQAEDQVEVRAKVGTQTQVETEEQDQKDQEEGSKIDNKRLGSFLHCHYCTFEDGPLGLGKK